MKSKLTSLLNLSAVALLAVIFCIVLALTGNTAKPVTTERVYDESGDEIYAVCISDIGELNTVPYLNYTPDVFVTPNTYQDLGQVIPVNGKTKLAPRGTLQFVFLNLNPDDENFKAKSEALSPRLSGDNYWHFTLYVPQVLSACNIYTQTVLVSRTGEISDYQFIEYCEYNDVTENHSDKIQPDYIDLKFYPRRAAMSPDLMVRAMEVTIHYEASGGRAAGLYQLPLIGTEKAVKRVVETNRSLLLAMTVLSAIDFLIFVFICILKRNLHFAPQLVFAAGVFLTLISTYLFTGTAVSPYLLLAIRKSSVGVLVVAACMNSPKVIKFPLKYITIGASVIACIFAFLTPLVPYSAGSVLTILCEVLATVVCAVMLAVTLYAAYDTGKFAQYINNVLTVVLTVFSSFFITRYVSLFMSPALWLYAFILAVIAVVGLLEFTTIELRNRYLTSNLHLEIDRQLKDIKSVVEERDNLLRFVSHDMKKPLTFSASLINTLIEREKDVEQTKMLRIVKQNNSYVIGNLSNIGVYARFNYIAEQSVVCDLFDICSFLYEFHQPDCNANGIVLKNSVNSHTKVFVKKQALENAASNIIINAIEHADCKTITLSAKITKNKVVLTVSDDGKGIADGLDVFKAYSSDAETGGVGLFICKNIIESMNGELSYESKRDGTAFKISLLKA